MVFITITLYDIRNGEVFWCSFIAQDWFSSSQCFCFPIWSWEFFFQICSNKRYHRLLSITACFTAIHYLPEHNNILFLKPPHIWVTELWDIKLLKIRKHHSFWLDFIELEGDMHSVRTEKLSLFLCCYESFEL